MTKFTRAFVWLGGVAFGGSLGLCAYAFLFVWSRVEPSRTVPDWRAATMNLALFAAFAAHHSVFARERVKAWMVRTVPDGLLRSVYVWTASALLAVLVLAWRPIGGELYRADGWLAYAHIIVQLTGVWLVARSVGAIDPLELAGIRQARERGGLQIAGPYRLVRHPLYLGWMLMVLGTAHMTGDRLIFASMTSLYLVVAIPWEERSLERAFGDAYRRYKERVRWRVIPYVY